MNREDKIKDLLYKFVGTKTYTNSELELNNIDYYTEFFNSIDYLKENPEMCGFYDIENDFHGRKVPWAFKKGNGPKTVVLIHHNDTVDIEDYGEYKEYAHDIDKITKMFYNGEIPVNEVVQADIDEGGWIFGRGVCDMKAGGVIQQALFSEYAADENFNGNILLLGLPDEENLSAGMIAAVDLMKELKDKYNLEYVLMIDSEPTQPSDPSKPRFNDGSIGKVMPIIYVKGKLAHSGYVYRGLNPINILAEIVRRTEISPEFLEKIGNTVTPPPTWLYFKDNKEVYDVSLPMSAGGYLSILTLEKNPKEILESIKKISIEAIDDVISDYDKSFSKFKELQGLDYDTTFKTDVRYFDDLYSEVIKDSENKEILDELEISLVSDVKSGDLDLRDACFRFMERTVELYETIEPIVIIGIAPPFYPSANNRYLEDRGMDDLMKNLSEFSKETFGVDYEIENFYTGISDLSYAMFSEDADTVSYIRNNMLLYGSLYKIPFELIKEISMPVLNIGPWGKDLHKGVERVYAEDVYINTPKYVDFAVKEILK